jgi:hypothetical protein
LKILILIVSMPIYHIDVVSNYVWSWAQHWLFYQEEGDRKRSYSNTIYEKIYQAIYSLDTDRAWIKLYNLLIMPWKFDFDGHHHNFVYKFLELNLKNNTKK